MCGKLFRSSSGASFADTGLDEPLYANRQRKLERPHSQFTVFDGASQLSLISHPDAVTAAIDQAANSVRQQGEQDSHVGFAAHWKDRPFACECVPETAVQQYVRSKPQAGRRFDGAEELMNL